MSIAISLIFTYLVYQNLTANYFGGLDTAVDLGMDPALRDEVVKLKSEGQRGAVTSGTKYLIVILLEVIVFHFSVKTLSILTDRQRRPSFKEFMAAEIRMIKIMIWNFIKGVIVSAVVAFILNIFGLGFATPIIMFFVYAYFMGYAFIDNYNEQFSFTIRKSQSIIRCHLGAALTIGVIVSVMIYIPLIGPLFAPIFGAVSAAIYGERFKIENALATI